MHFVYVLKNLFDKFYIGYTNNLNRRTKEHQREDASWRLIYCEVYTNVKIAKLRERKLKYYGSAWRALKKRLLA